MGDKKDDSIDDLELANVPPPDPDAAEAFEVKDPVAADDKPAGKAKTTRLRPRTDPYDKLVKESSAPTVSSARPTLALGAPQKYTKKEKEELKDWRAANRAPAVDSYFKAQLEIGRQRHGHTGMFVGSPKDTVIIGIPCPALVFEYLLGQTVFPLSLIVHLNGPAGSCKSSLLYEFMRWFRDANGGAELMEVETKFNPDFMDAIISGGTGRTSNVLLNKCTSVEDWQTAVLEGLKRHKMAMEPTGGKGPGRIVPVLFGVDSIVGKAAQETQEKVRETGYAARNFPLEALSITTFMKTVPQLLDGWPFTLVLNNHEKLGTDERGHETRRTAGGVGVNFQESFEFVTRVSKHKLECMDWEGRQIRVKCVKSSFGPSIREIETRLLWWHEIDPVARTAKLVSRWDWNWSLIRLLTEIKGRHAKNMADMGVHVKAERVSDYENSAWSKNLGMKAADAVSWTELGAKIMQDAKLVSDIRIALGISERPVLSGGYLDQLNELGEQMP